MLNMIRADLYKMFKSSTIKILFGITTLCAIVMTLMAYLIQLGKLDNSMIGIGFLLSDVNVISILGAVIAGAFICSDFENKTIHEAITCGCKRSSIIISKAIVFFCAVAFIILPYAITTGIALNTGSKFSMGSVALGFLNLLTQKSDIAFQTSTIPKLLIVMLTLIILYVAQLSICIPLALLIKKPVVVVAIFYSISILSGQAATLSKSSQVFDNILSCTPFGGNYNLLTVDASTGDIVKAISASLIFIIVILTFTYSIFRKAEIK